MPAANKIAQAEKIIEQCYVDTVDTDQLAQEAIKAMLATLDPHSTYSDPEETKELTTPSTGISQASAYSSTCSTTPCM